MRHTSIWIARFARNWTAIVHTAWGRTAHVHVGGGLRTRNRVIEAPRSMELIWIDVTTMQWWSRKCTRGTRISLVNVSAVTLECKDVRSSLQQPTCCKSPRMTLTYSYRTSGHSTSAHHKTYAVGFGWRLKPEMVAIHFVELWKVFGSKWTHFSDRALCIVSIAMLDALTNWAGSTCNASVQYWTFGMRQFQSIYIENL